MHSTNVVNSIYPQMSLSKWTTSLALGIPACLEELPSHACDGQLAGGCHHRQLQDPGLPRRETSQAVCSAFKTARSPLAEERQGRNGGYTSQRRGLQCASLSSSASLASCVARRRMATSSCSCVGLLTVTVTRTWERVSSRLQISRGGSPWNPDDAATAMH